MPSYLRRVIVSLVTALAIFVALPVCASPRISSTFIQLGQEKSSYIKSDWNWIFRALHHLGINEVVLQWTAINRAPYLKAYKRVDLVVSIGDFIELAEKNRIRLKIGLIHDPEYWERIKESPKSLKVYFARLTHDSVKLAGELFQEIGYAPSFSGWYLPQEIDDVNWIKPERKKILRLYLREISSRLKHLSPEKEISISTFNNCNMSPLGMASLWEKILLESHIDTLYFQDGIGAKKQDLNTLPLYLEALSKMTRKCHVLFEPIVEIFDLPSGKGPFHIIPPSSSARVIKQIDLASKYSSHISSFGLIECITSKSDCYYKELLKRYPDLRDF